MCGDKTGGLLLAAISSATAVRKEKRKTRVRSGHAGMASGKQKLPPWTGLRFRDSGRWATEIRLPRTREKVWIGTFTSPRQAALAYDAAVFCIFGERTPKSRKTNFPAAPRPKISESERLKLSVADIKAISEKHAREVDALLPPLADEDSTAAPDDLVVAPAMPAAVDAPPAGEGGPAPPDSLDDDEIYQLIRDFNIDTYWAELDAVSDGVY